MVVPGSALVEEAPRRACLTGNSRVLLFGFMLHKQFGGVPKRLILVRAWKLLL